jgi:hypothetical protein
VSITTKRYKSDRTFCKLVTTNANQNKYLNEARVTAGLRNRFMPGQDARVLHKISEVLSKKEETKEEGERKRREAQAILQRMRSATIVEEVENSEDAYDELVYSLWR